MSGQFNQFKQWANRWLPDKSKAQFFLIFVVISVVFWVLTRFSNVYIASVDFDVEFENIPKEITISNAPTEIVASVEASGFQLLLYQIFGKTLKVNLQNAQLEDRSGRINLLIQQAYLSSQLFENSRITLLKASNLFFDLERLEKKTVPVLLVSEISFKTGFNFSQAPIVEPDSIEIMGAGSEIGKIDVIPTGILVKSELNRDFSETLALQFPEGVQESSHQLVIVRAKTAKFTEMTYDIPIQMKKPPKNKRIRLFPPTVKIRGLVPLRLVDSISPTDFEMTVNFNDSKAVQQKTLSVTMARQSPHMRSIRWSPHSVNYLIRQ
jgi:hypothetical protein